MEVGPGEKSLQGNLDAGVEFARLGVIAPNAVFGAEFKQAADPQFEHAAEVPAYVAGKTAVAEEAIVELRLG